MALQGRRLDSSVRTVTFHALVYQPVEKGAAVVAESRAGVRVDLELVFTPRILQVADTERDRVFIRSGLIFLNAITSSRYSLGRSPTPMEIPRNHSGFYRGKKIPAA